MATLTRENILTCKVKGSVDREVQEKTLQKYYGVVKGMMKKYGNTVSQISFFMSFDDNYQSGYWYGERICLVIYMGDMKVLIEDKVVRHSGATKRIITVDGKYSYDSVGQAKAHLV